MAALGQKEDAMGNDESMRQFGRQLGLVVLGTALILLAPLLAMQFTDEVAWDGYDFAAAAVLLGGTGLVYLILARLFRSARSRLLLGMAMAAVLLLAWAELAVGVFGTPFAGS
jgi:hypothetical protein